MDQFRLYHNFFARIEKEKFTILPMFDLGFQKDTLNSFKNWFSYGISIKYQLPKSMAIAARYEHMNDPHNIIPEINAHTPHGFIQSGYTLTYEIRPAKLILIRIEARYTNVTDPVFTTATNHLSKSDFFLLGAFCVTLNSEKMNQSK